MIGYAVQFFFAIYLNGQVMSFGFSSINDCVSAQREVEAKQVYVLVSCRQGTVSR